MSIKDDLFLLKSKLEDIEGEMNKKVISLNDSEKLVEETNQKVLKKLEYFPKTCKLNIGGQRFSTYFKHFINFQNSLFYFIISQDNFEVNSEIYFERSPKFFDEILNFLKHEQIIQSRYSNEDLNEIRAEAEYYGLNKLSALIDDDIADPLIVSFTSNGPYNNIGSTEVAAILFPDPNSGLTSGYPGQFVFVLEKVANISEIEFMGFFGNNSFSATNGSNSKIEASVDGINYAEVGYFPQYSNDYLVQKFSVKFKGKYVRITNNLSYIGFSYLKFKS